MTERARSFGAVAAAYDRYRPGYPRELFAELLAVAGLGPTAQVLEVGAGTGKATVELAAVAGEVVAVEPDPEMADVARRVLDASPEPTDHVTVEVAAFEDLSPATHGTFDLVVSAQAWHWPDPATKHDRAADLLRPGGWLAVLWHLDRLLDDDLVAAIERVHEDLAPGRDIATRTMGREDDDDHERPALELAATARFGDVRRLERSGTRTVTTAEFVGLLDTVSAYRILPDDLRSRLLAAIATAIDAHGGTVTSEGGIRLFAAPRR